MNTKNYQSYFTRVLLLMLLLSTKSILAQTMVTVGTVSTSGSSNYPVATFYNYCASECIYTGTEIGTTGSITKLAYNKTAGTNITTNPAVKIYLKTTTATTLGNNSYTVGTGFSGYTLVYDGTLPNIATTGWMEVTLTTPFTYSSTSQNVSVLVIGTTFISSGRPNYNITSVSGGDRRTGYYTSDSAAWTSSSSMATAVDRPNIRLTLASANNCNVPVTPTATNVTPTTATISWTAPTIGTTPPAYQWEVRSAGAAGSGETGRVASGTASALNAAVTGLRGNTLYTIYVRSACGNDAYSSWVNGTFTTPCDAVNAPYTQNFDAATNTPSCTAIEDVNNDTKTWAVNTSSGVSSSNALRYTYSSSVAANDWWITPGINVTAGETYKISFVYKGNSASNAERLEVKTGTSQNAGSMTGAAIYSNSAILNTSFETATINYVATTTGVQYFGWHAISAANQYYLYIDDVSIVHVPSCSTVTFPQSIVAQASRNTICSQEALSFSLSTPLPLSTGITYQWKSSPDGVTYLNEGLPAATPVKIMTANTNANYFKCDVLCNATVVVTSAPVAINIQVSVLSTTEGTGCANTPINLSATTQTGNTLKWYETSVGGSPLNTGTVYTPSLTESKTYYVAATGTLTNYSAGAASPGNLSASSYGGSVNGGESMKFNLTEEISLKSVTIYPVDPQANNIIYLKDANSNIIYQLTFSTIGTSPVSGPSTVGAPYIVNLNWSIPAGTGYKLEWGIPDYAGTNRLIRNASGASALYNVNNNGLTFTGNSSSFGNGYWFYFYDWKFTKGCGESAIRVPVTATVKAEWNGDADSNWSNPANWCGNALPTAATNVSVNTSFHNPEIATGTAYANNLTLQPGTALTVKTGATLSVENTLTTTGATLTVQNNAALLQGSLATTNTNVGNITAIKNSNSLYRLDYTLWSAPVTGQNLRDFSQQTVTTRFYEYKYVEQYDQEYYTTVDPLETSFATAKSYLIRMPDTDGTPNYDNGTAPISFAGTFTGAPHNGTITVDASVNGRRYTAIGNPYPSPISIASFFTQNSGVLDPASAIYFWRKKNNASKPSYATITRAGYIANTAGGGAGNQLDFYGDPDNYANWLIAPGQGFIVRTKVNPENTQFVFNNAMRRAARPSGTQGFFRTAPTGASRFWLNLTAAEDSFSQMAVAYTEEATTGIDYGFDGRAFADSDNIALYTVAQDIKLSIQARPSFADTDVVAMGYRATDAGNYTIAIDHTDGTFAGEQAIFIKDAISGNVHNLKEGNYTFAAEAGTFNDRFEILYTTEALGTDNPALTADNLIVYKEGNVINVTSGNTLITDVNVYDTRGRKLYNSQNMNAVQTTVTGLTAQQQVLIIEVTTTKGKTTKKLVF